jgi:hypothetical protein
VEVSRPEGIALPVLPALVRPGWADEVDVERLVSCEQVRRTDVGGIHQMGGGGQPLGRQRRVDRLGPHGLVDVGRRGIGVHHQTRRVLIARLGQVHHVAGPPHAALAAVAGFRIIGGL